jgi:hypothetical protein
MAAALFGAITHGRTWLAALAGLRWARPAGLDLVVPAGAIVVVFYAVPQLGRDVFGVPFWLAWLLSTVAVATCARATIAALSLVGARASATAGDQVARPPISGRWAGRLDPSVGAFSFRRLSSPQLLLLAEVVTAWSLYDILLWQQTNHLYDLSVYLAASDRWLHGGQAYMTATLSAWPASAQADFFLYAPPLLPFFALLAQLPQAPVAVGWTAFQAGCWYLSFRELGLPRPLSIALLAFPPVMIGLESGNVAGLVFLLFVAGARAGGTLVADGLFKVQAGIPMLWLARQGLWVGLAAGAAAMAVIVLVTLPLVGSDAWSAWWNGLGYRAASQAAAVALYGYSYAQVLPAPAWIAASAALTLLALTFRGRGGLAALGLASIFASPALWPHGFVFALPALLMLESGTAIWLVLGAGAFGPNMWLLFGVGWLSILAARRLPSGRLHPLAGRNGPWPAAPPFGTSDRRVLAWAPGRPGMAGQHPPDTAGAASPGIDQN